jgi:PhnB protein
MNTKNKLHGEAEVRTLLDGWAAAIRSKDSDAVLSHYASDLVQFDLAPPLEYSGKNALDKKNLETWFSTFNGPIAYEIRNLKITAGAEVAFCHSLNHLSGTKTTGERVDLWLRATAGFRKVDGKWTIAHWHESVPFYMDGSYRAAIDLKPSV